MSFGLPEDRQEPAGGRIKPVYEWVMHQDDRTRSSMSCLGEDDAYWMAGMGHVVERIR